MMMKVKKIAEVILAILSIAFILGSLMVLGKMNKADAAITGTRCYKDAWGNYTCHDTDSLNTYRCYKDHWGNWSCN